MDKKVITRITVVSFIVGVMIAVQYNTVQMPTTRDTRDIWEIRQELSEEKKRHSELLSEIATLSSVVEEYENNDTESQAQILKDTVEELKQRAGLSSITGPGVVLNIVPAAELLEMGFQIEPISPNLLIRLVNEIYRYNGHFIEIDGQRLVHTSAIRDINGKTTVNGVPIDSTNIDIYIITENFEKAEKLYSYLFASAFRDDFYLDNLSLVINEAQPSITVSAYDGNLSNTYLVENDKGE
ncbi:MULTISPECIES: DUF881 domain-containing protein [Lysinibacillus]|uniref:DUF881 domain-containing protein n=1 Tax=Lysinibacillus antri TaxID=2498145 RepID=A0A3S0R875_9BACI|nr:MULTISPECIES: DUF881 domain-containing protein [Lysinibacillus]RUL55902.1 DUF881 domain-containing protein [Lysinibacillus antri]TSI11505.1 DUF881 domain-containing protein [Lysinibacillus sp. BW-2-10]